MGQAFRRRVAPSTPPGRNVAVFPGPPDLWRGGPLYRGGCRWGLRVRHPIIDLHIKFLKNNPVSTKSTMPTGYSGYPRRATLIFEKKNHIGAMSV